MATFSIPHFSMTSKEVGREVVRAIKRGSIQHTAGLANKAFFFFFVILVLIDWFLF